MKGFLLGLLATAVGFAAPPSDLLNYQQRVDAVRQLPGFGALWDFVKRDAGRFAAWQAPGDRHDFRLDAVNYVRDYWRAGPRATYQDFPLLGRGPFGEAIRLRQETDKDLRPVLLVPRERLQDSGLDVKGPGQSVSMVAWVIRESGNHAIAGIWHEGTDLADATSAVQADATSAVQKVERGRRQYALFAGLAANNGAAAVHVSENGGASFGDKYARNLAVTPELLPTAPAGAMDQELDQYWSLMGMVFDNEKNTVTAYLDGKASEMWVENPAAHPFFQWASKGWTQEQYRPPEATPLSVQVLAESSHERVELHTFAFTKVRVTLRGGAVVSRELVALRTNPFWFPHDLYVPPTTEDGGPFTIGRVIHTSRSVGFTGYIGGVAVFNRALSAQQMEKLALIARTPLVRK